MDCLGEVFEIVDCYQEMSDAGYEIEGVLGKNVEESINLKTISGFQLKEGIYRGVDNELFRW